MSGKKSDEKLESEPAGNASVTEIRRDDVTAVDDNTTKKNETDDLYDADSGFSVVVAKRRSRRKRIIGLVVVLMLILLGVTGWILWRKPAAKPGTGAQTQLSSAALADAVNNKIAGKDYQGAVELIESQKGQSDLDAQLLLVSAHVGNGDLKSALVVYDGLDKAGKLSGVNTIGAAQVAEQAEDYAVAVRYYTAAKTRIQAEKPPTAADLLQICDAKIAELKDKG